jgi:hypothetical protein
MKVLKNVLWIIVVLLALQVIKVLLNRAAMAWSSLGIIVTGCLQFFVVVAGLCLWLLASVLKRVVRLRRPVMAACFIVCGSMASVECLMAWWMYHPAQIPLVIRPSYCYYYDYFQEDLLQFDARYATYDKDFFYALKPDTTFNFRNIEFNSIFRTNRIGMRDGDTALSSAQVACLGDSYTMGWGVGEGESFPARLSALSGLRVVNMGMASFGTARELKSLQRIDISHLQWLVIQYCSNDQDENKVCTEHNYVLPISTPSKYKGLVEAAASSRHYFPGKYLLIIGNYFWKTMLNRIYPFFSLRWERKDWGKGQEGQAKLFMDVLLHSSIDFRKTKVVLTMMDDVDNMRGNFLREIQRLSATAPYNERLAGGLHVLDADTLLSQDDRYILDMHFKASGHEKVARALSRILQSEANLKDATMVNQ